MELHASYIAVVMKAGNRNCLLVEDGYVCIDFCVDDD